MRLDKYLKVCRILKRRTLSHELLSLGLVEINGKVAKPSTNVKVGDVLAIKMKGKITTVVVKEVKEYVKADECYSMYEVLKEETIQTEEEN